MDETQDISRREAMKTALKAGAYVAPVILSAAVPAGVLAANSPTLPPAINPPPVDNPPPPPTTVTLVLSKSVTPISGVVPTTATFTVTVTNNGPVAASAITVRDLLDPAAFTIQNATMTPGTIYNAPAGVLTIPSLAVGETATLTINVLAIADGPRTNTATLTASTPPNTGNNQASATFTGITGAAFG